MTTSACKGGRQSSTTCLNPFRGETGDSEQLRAAPAANPGLGLVLPETWHDRIWRTGGAVRADGKGIGRGPPVAVERRDARRYRGMPIAARSARDSNRHFHFISARRFLGSVGRRMGIHSAELHYRVDARRALRSLQRLADSHRNLLRRKSRGDSADPALVLPAREARHGRLAAMDYRGYLFRDNRRSKG